MSRSPMCHQEQDRSIRRDRSPWAVQRTANSSDPLQASTPLHSCPGGLLLRQEWRYPNSDGVYEQGRVARDDRATEGADGGHCTRPLFSNSRRSPPPSSEPHCASRHQTVQHHAGPVPRWKVRPLIDLWGRGCDGARLLFRLRCKIIDYDLARASYAEQWVASNPCGTAEFMAPEILENKLYTLVRPALSFCSCRIGSDCRRPSISGL